MRLEASDPGDYLGADDIIEAGDPGIRALATSLRDRHTADIEFTRAAYEWVRDEVTHSYDAGDTRVTLTASEVLEAKTGLCFAKSHLLAAILRGQGIPTGLCYQRLGDETEGFVLHGLVAVHLDGEWHRLDPRGNNGTVDAQFDLEAERLAYEPDASRGEVDYPTVYAAPAESVVGALRGAADAVALCGQGLPSAL